MTVRARAALPIVEPHQYSFAVVAPGVRAALLFGALGGFVLAVVITLGRMIGWRLGLVEVALIQAHGHAQMMGWIGLFILAVASHVLPRLRGTPLALAGALPWVWGALALGLTLRLLSQPLAMNVGALWRAGMVTASLLELGATWTLVAALVLTMLRGPALADRPALRGVLPFLLIAMLGLILGPVVTLVGVTQAATASHPLIPTLLDEMIVAIGLLGFIVPMALAMAVRFLPLYGRLRAFPRAPLVIGQTLYVLGLLLLPWGALDLWPAAFALSHAIIGLSLSLFAATFGWMIGQPRPAQVRIAPRPGMEAATSPRSETLALAGLTALAFFWLFVAGGIMMADGFAMLLSGTTPIPLDAARHSLAFGFAGLLLLGIAPRLVPAFSGGKLRSSSLLVATFWLGLPATVARVGAVLLESVAPGLSAVMLAVSGVLGLALAWLLLLNLWPALPVRARPALPGPHA